MTHRFWFRALLPLMLLAAGGCEDEDPVTAPELKELRSQYLPVSNNPRCTWLQVTYPWLSDTSASSDVSRKAFDAAQQALADCAVPAKN